LRGSVTDVTSSGDSVEIAGTLTETDYGTRGGEVFKEFDVPFVITANEGSRTFVFQFCLVPPFTMEIAHGLYRVDAGPSLAMFDRPAVRSSMAGLPCPTPIP
jgi:hypothetical protein